jgi:hypothetical protein
VILAIEISLKDAVSSLRPVSRTGFAIRGTSIVVIGSLLAYERAGVLTEVDEPSTPACFSSSVAMM